MSSVRVSLRKPSETDVEMQEVLREITPEHIAEEPISRNLPSLTPVHLISEAQSMELLQSSENTEDAIAVAPTKPETLPAEVLPTLGDVLVEVDDCLRLRVTSMLVKALHQDWVFQRAFFSASLGQFASGNIEIIKDKVVMSVVAFETGEYSSFQSTSLERVIDLLAYMATPRATLDDLLAILRELEASTSDNIILFSRLRVFLASVMSGEKSFTNTSLEAVLYNGSAFCFPSAIMSFMTKHLLRLLVDWNKKAGEDLGAAYIYLLNIKYHDEGIRAAETPGNGWLWSAGEAYASLYIRGALGAPHITPVRDVYVRHRRFKTARVFASLTLALGILGVISELVRLFTNSASSDWVTSLIISTFACLGLIGGILIGRCTSGIGKLKLRMRCTKALENDIVLGVFEKSGYDLQRFLCELPEEDG